MRKLLIALLVGLLGTTALAQDQSRTPRLEDLVPDHTFGLVSIHDAPAMARQASRTSLAQLWREPEVQQFLKPLLGMMEEQVAGLERKIGHPISGLMEMFAGQIGVAVVEFDPLYGGMVPDLVALVDLGDHRGQFEALHDQALTGGGDVRVEPRGYKGVAWESIVVPGGVEIGLVYLGDAVVVTSRPERTTKVIDAYLTGLPTALSKNLTYQRTLAGAGGESTFATLFVNVEAIIGYFAEQMGPDEMRIMEVMGLTGLRGACWGVSFVEEGIRDSMYLYAPGKKRGLLKLFYSSPGDGTRLLARIPREAFYASCGRVDFEKLLDGVLEMVGQVEPYMLDEVRGGIREAEEFLGLRIREDLLRPFGEEMAMYMSLSADGGIFPNLVILSRLRDPERFESAMEQLVARAKVMAEDGGRHQVEHRRMDFMGKVIHYVHVAQKHGSPFPITPCYVMDGDLMAMALVPHTLKDFIARGRDGPSILSRPDFQRVLKGLPEGVTAVDYLDLNAAIRLLYGTGAPIAQMFLKQVGVPVDPALMPRTETIAKHFFGMGSGMLADESGVAIHVYSPTGIAPMVAAIAVPFVFLMASGGVAEPPVMVTPFPEPAPPGPAIAESGQGRAVLEEIYIGLLFHYAQTDQYAASLADLVTTQALEGADALILPGDESPLPLGGAGGGMKSSFTYVGPAVGHILEGQDRAVWVYSRDGLGQGSRWVLFASGRVRQVPEAEFQSLLAETMTRLK